MTSRPRGLALTPPPHPSLFLSVSLCLFASLLRLRLSASLLLLDLLLTPVKGRIGNPPPVKREIGSPATRGSFTGQSTLFLAGAFPPGYQSAFSFLCCFFDFLCLSISLPIFNSSFTLTSIPTQTHTQFSIRLCRRGFTVVILSLCTHAFDVYFHVCHCTQCAHDL